VIAFTPDGSQIATGSADRTLRLWDAATAKTCTRSRPTPGTSAGSRSRPMGRPRDGRLRPREPRLGSGRSQADGGVSRSTTGPPCRSPCRPTGRRSSPVVPTRTSSGGAPPQRKNDRIAEFALATSDNPSYLVRSPDPLAPSLSRRSFRHAAEPVRESTEGRTAGAAKPVGSRPVHHPAADRPRLSRRRPVVLCDGAAVARPVGGGRLRARDRSR